MDTLAPVPKVQPDELRARVAQRIRDAAKRKGVALTHLADAAEVSRSGLWQILNGEVGASIDTLARLALVLGIDPGELSRPYRKPKSPPT